jgi:hypothetical protein
MAGLVPAIYALTQRRRPDQPRVDGRDKPGHDEIGVPPLTFIKSRVGRRPVVNSHVWTAPWMQEQR